MLELAGFFAPDATFDLYRIVAENGLARRGDFVQAIGNASSKVDLLNLSVGIYHDEEPDGDCGGHCRVADETRLAIENGLSVVSATGNRDREDALAVHCPALRDDVIGVGGFVSHCRHNFVDSEDSGQYWTRHNGAVDGPFCGQQGCTPSEQCEAHRYEKPWQGNVSFHNAVPDVLAPVHHPAGTETEPILQSGTSFGTPVVTGILAAILSDRSEAEDDSSPAELHRAVSMGATEIDEGGLPKFDALDTRGELTTWENQ